MTIESFPAATTPTRYMKWGLRVIPYIGMFILVLLLWLPFNLKTTGLIEEWGITTALDRGQQLFFVTPASDLAVARGRPLEMLPFALSYTLDHNSFTYYNIFMILFFFGKIVFAYWLMLEFLPGYKLLAFIISVLFVIYPADTGLFTLRTIHIHSAVLTYLIATYLLVLSRKLANRSKWLALVGTAFFLLVSLWQYPSTIPIIIVTPVLLLYFSRPNRRFLISTAIWYGAAAVALLYSTWAIHQTVASNSYDQQFLQQITFSLTELKNMLMATLMAYQRQFSSWAVAAGKMNYLLIFWPFVLGGVVVTSGVGYWLLHQQPKTELLPKLTPNRYLLLVVSGFILFGVGIALYVVVPDLRFTDFRAYYVAALGSALVVSLILYLISSLSQRYHQLIFLGLSLPFVALALLNALQLQQHNANFSLEQQAILQDMVQQAPQIKPDTFIVVTDPITLINREYIFYFGAELQAALGHLYSNPSIAVQYCPVEGRPTILGITCQFEADGLAVTSTNTSTQANTMKIPADRLLVFSSEYNGRMKLLTSAEAKAQYKITGYDPQNRVMGSTLPPRYFTLFSCVPALSCYHSSPHPVSDTFNLSDVDEIGLGWRGTELDDKNGTFRWSINPISTVNVHINQNGDLALDFKVLHWVDDEVINSLKLSVNGQNIPLTFTSEEPSTRLYHALIPQTMPDSQLTDFVIVFTVDHLTSVSASQQLGFALNGLDIRPA